jgi:hypothetical protein
MNSADRPTSAEQAATGATRAERPVALYACGVLVLLGFAASLLSNVGFCIPAGKILSNDDFFKGVIDVVLHDPVDGVVEYIPGASVAKAVRSQRYSSPDEFLSENPRCCRFVAANSGDGGPEVSVLDLLKGVRVVEVSYEKRYDDEAGAQKKSKVSAKVAVTSCGTGRPFR